MNFSSFSHSAFHSFVFHSNNFIPTFFYSLVYFVFIYFTIVVKAFIWLFIEAINRPIESLKRMNEWDEREKNASDRMKNEFAIDENCAYMYRYGVCIILSYFYESIWTTTTRIKLHILFLLLLFFSSTFLFFRFVSIRKKRRKQTVYQLLGCRKHFVTK